MPQQGALDIKTEFGRMRVEPNEICVIQVKQIQIIIIHRSTAIELALYEGIKFMEIKNK